MQRILVLGSGGAGKSTLARQLGQALDLPVFHLDAMFWQPGWVMTPRDQELAILREAVRGDRWIIDGNYGAGELLDLRVAAADTAIFLDLPRTVCLLRAVRRWLAYRGRTRPDMGPGCPERLTWEFVRWIWQYPERERPRLLGKLESAPHIRLVRLSSTAAVEGFLAGPPEA